MRSLFVACAGIALSCVSAVVAAQPATGAVAAARMTSAECEVWARELSFAQSVADHDADAFAAHLEPDAAFGASLAEPTRGREAITRRWNAIIEGKRVKLAWYPTRTTVGGADNVAWSSGPALFEDPDTRAEHRYRIGGFRSVWHRGGDGVWRVLFDDGVEPQPATEAEVAAFHAGRSGRCPQG